MSSKTSKLIRDLDSVPSIVGNLGLSIAAAQKAFNLDYLESLERLVALIKSMLGTTTLNDNDRLFFESVLTRLAPPSYQYTETTLSVKLDLAQSQRTAVTGNLGVGVGAVTIGAAMSSAFGLDYRAAAECQTVIHARNLDPSAMQALFERAAEISEKSLELPADTPRIDHQIVESAQELMGKITGSNPTPIGAPSGQAGGAPATGGASGGGTAGGSSTPAGG